MNKKSTIKVKNYQMIESQMNKLGFNRTLLQNTADLSNPTIREILNSNNESLSITPRTAHKFCKALKVQFDEIFEIS